MKNLLLPVVALLMALPAFAQKSYRVTGSLIDSADQATVVGALATLTDQSDTSQQFIGTSNERGVFSIMAPSGNYLLSVTSLGYLPAQLEVSVEDRGVSVGKVILRPDEKVLGETVVEGDVEPVIQRGDTIQYNADAFKTNPDATAGDLLNKMPGITSDNGQTQAQGETVQKVLVDGKEFFGNDPKAALDNLPAEAVDKIEVYDEPSEQTQETGFDDGQRIKTINIVTKENKRNGQFGRVFAGAGGNEEGLRYAAGGNVNFFSGKSRLSVIGLANNINEQNFSIDDILGVTGNNNSRRGGRGMGGGPRGMNSMMAGGFGFGMGGDVGSFLVSQQGGITETGSFGLNYSDTWFEKVDFSGSYFFNTSDNDNRAAYQRTFFLTDTASSIFNEGDTTRRRNTNHRFNSRITWRPDSKNTVIMRTSLSTQFNEGNQKLLGENRLSPLAPPSSITNNLTRARNTGFFGNNFLFYSHRFNTRKRTISAFVNTQVSNNMGETTLLARSEFPDRGVTQVTDQLTENQGDGYNLSGNVSYTEPIAGTGQLQVAYAVSYAKNFSERLNFFRDPVEEAYSVLDTGLSNKFDNDYLTHTVGLGYNWRRIGSKTFFVVGLNYEMADLVGEQTFPTQGEVNRSFRNLLPVAVLRTEPFKNSNLFFVYSARTNAPSIAQLQNVVNNTNPLLLTTGNEDLQQEYTHFMVARFNATKLETSETFFAFALLNATERKIGTETLIASGDTLDAYGVPIAPGAQLSRPINLNGFFNARAYLGYGRPLKFIKSNLNLNLGFNYQKTPGKINDQTNLSNNYTFSPGISISSNISENVDFTVGTRSNYSIVENSVQPELNNNFFYQLNNADLSLIFWEGFVFRAQAQNYWYSGLGDEFDQNFTLVNMSIGKKLFHGNLGEISLSIFDLFGQNNSIQRTVTETFVEDNRTRVLTRYVMLNFSYRVRNFRR